MANEQSLEVVSKVLGITPRRIRDLSKDGILPPIISGRIDFPLSCMMYIEYKNKLQEGGGSLSLTDERCRLTKINADRKELQLDRERGELLHVDAVMMFTGAVMQNIRNKMLALPKKMSPIVFGSKSIPEVEEVIKKYVYECLTEVSEPDFKSIARMAEGKGNNRNAKAAEKPNSKPVVRRGKNTKS